MFDLNSTYDSKKKNMILQVCVQNANLVGMCYNYKIK